MNKPTLTIGLPVFNGGSYLATAIDSLLSQSSRDFTLVISDNASNDNTPVLCQTAAQRDSRVIYFRQSENIGLNENFKFVLAQASSPYFMFAAHDDRWHHLFVEKNLALLNANPLAIASISQVEFHYDGVSAFKSVSTYPLQGSVRENLRRYWQHPRDNSRFYGIHRTDVLRKSFPDIPPYHALDWLITALTLRFGHYLEVPEVLMWRSASESDRYVRQVAQNDPMFLTRVFPLLPISYYAIIYLGWRNLSAYFANLLRLNLLMHQTYIGFLALRYPRLFRPLKLVFRASGLKQLFYKWQQEPEALRDL